MLEKIMADAAAASIATILREELMPEMQTVLSRHPEPVSVSIADGASMIGISDTYLRSLIEEGAIRSFRLGRRVLIPVAEIYLFVQSRLESET